MLDKRGAVKRAIIKQLGRKWTGNPDDIMGSDLRYTTITFEMFLKDVKKELEPEYIFTPDRKFIETHIKSSVSILIGATDRATKVAMSS